jgi:hypothetical protein
MFLCDMYEFANICMLSRGGQVKFISQHNVDYPQNPGFVAVSKPSNHLIIDFKNQQSIIS